MEDKSGFERLLNTSQGQTKRLSFDFLNNSEMSTKKRRRDDAQFDETSGNLSKTLNETMNSSAGSLSSSISAAPWEMKMLRIDLTEAQTRIAQLKKEIHHQTIIQTEMELKFAAKEKSLESEMVQFKNKAGEYERILKKNRKNENQLKEDLVKANNQLLLQKQSYDQAIFKVQNENKGLQETLNYKTNALQNKISEITRELNDIKSHHDTSNEELKSLREINEDLAGKLSEYTTIKNDLEQEKIKYQEAASQLKKLEYEANSSSDWKEVEKASASRMLSMSEIEKEITRLREVNRNLNDSLGNKLLLEEQVHSLTTRLERYEKINEDQIVIKSKMSALEKELIDWHQLGVDFVPKGCSPNPINVRSYIEKLLHRDLQLVSEKSDVSSEKSTILSEMSDYKMKNEALARQAESFEKSLKTHQAIVLKLQKKMRLVQNERDAQRQLIDSYEKDLTINPGNNTLSSGAQETQNKLRIEMLQNSEAGYKELCARLEQENAELRGNPSLTSISDPTFCTNEQYKALRKDLEALRMENEKLRKRKNELEVEIENLTLRNNCLGDDHLKVVHFKNNPASIAQEQVAEEVVKLKAEVERLKIRNRKLEVGNEDLTARVNETMNMTLNVKDLQKLKDEYAQLQVKCQENEKLFTKINKELREVIYFLFGYKLDRYGNSNYRIISMYADHETDELIFQLNEGGGLDMLETEYSKLLSEFSSQYLHGPQGSLASFTAALTLELVNRATVTTVE